LRSKETPNPNKYFGESDMIKHILKKDYQPVLDHFVSTFQLPVNKYYSKKFEQEMKNIDRSLTFANENEAALYKLKQAHNIFFSQSLP
jgi:predicted ATP-grasp superfamily ATP-dependent carboligase